MTNQNEGNQEQVTSSENQEEAQVALAAEEVQKPSRIGKFLRAALRWITGLMTIFAFGVALTWFMRVRPLEEQAKVLKAERETATEQVVNLEAELEGLRTVEAENKTLTDSLTLAEHRLMLLDLLVDVKSAQLALAADDIDTVRSVLVGVGLKLDKLAGALSDDYADSVQAMQERLDLLSSELDGQIFAARNDLEVLAESIEALERSLRLE